MKINFKELDINDLKPQTGFEVKVVVFIKQWFSHSETVGVQTSGSTGTPKIFEVDKEKMRSSAKMTTDFLGLKEGDTALLCLPVEYISGKMMIVRSIKRHLNLIVNDPSLKPLENLTDSVDFCAMTPLQVEHSLDKIHRVKNLIIGGAAVSESLKEKIYTVLRSSEYQTKIFETYGMSETLSHIALKEIYPKAEDFFSTFEGVEITLDERGCLVIFSPKLNSEKLVTNDLVELSNERQFRYLGRADNVINSGGSKIFPEQLESVAKKTISNELVFLGIKDESLGQKLMLVIEGAESDEIKKHISEISFEKSFHKPKGIIFVDEIPRTPNGKVNRPELLKMIQNS